MRRNGDNSWAGWERDRPCDEVSGGRWRAHEKVQRDCRGRGTEALATGRSISTWGMVSQNMTVSSSRIYTLNSKLAAEGEIICTSCAVAALCIAFAPGWANETLPTVTVWTIVRD